MTLRSLRAAVLTASLSLLAVQAQAGTPLGGLTVAVHPDGTRLVVGGDSRTLYELDAATLEVKRRVWTGTTLLRLLYSKDGSKLWAEDTSKVTRVYETAGFTKVLELKKASYLASARQADLVVGLDDNFKGHVLTAYSMSDGAVKGSVTLPKGTKVGCFGLNAAGTELAVMTEGEKDPDEPKLSSSKAPKELKGLDKVRWKHQHDGKTSWLRRYSLPAFEQVAEAKTWFKTQAGSLVVHAGEQVLVVNYSNENARFDAAGEASLFALAHGLNYGAGMSEDRGVVMGGGLASVSRTTVADLAGVKLRLDKLPGWPEYMRGFAFAMDGVGYGATSGYRVVRVSAEGKLEKAAPVY